MGKRRGLIETLEDFFEDASADAAELITKQVMKMNKENQARHGRTVTRKRKRKTEGQSAATGPHPQEMAVAS